MGSTTRIPGVLKEFIPKEPYFRLWLPRPRTIQLVLAPRLRWLIHPTFSLVTALNTNTKRHKVARPAPTSTRNSARQ
jgi:hypothetical protein